MMLPDLPEHITEHQLDQALDALGIPAEHLTRITIANGTVEVEYFRIGNNGHGMLGHHRTCATVTTTIRVSEP